MLVWTRLGWLVPAIVVLVLVTGQLGLNAALGEGFYEQNEWVPLAALIVSAMIVGVVGFYLNNKRADTQYINEKTGQRVMEGAHTFFFIRFDFWAVLIPLIAVAIYFHDRKTDTKELAYLESPSVGDLYVVDFLDVGITTNKDYPFGVLKVVRVDDDTVETMVSSMQYERHNSIISDMKKNKLADSVLYPDGSIEIDRTQLIEWKNANQLKSVERLE